MSAPGPRVLTPVRGAYKGRKVHVEEIGTWHVMGRVVAEDGLYLRVFIDRACFQQDLGPSDDARIRAERERKRAKPVTEVVTAVELHKAWS